MIVLLIAFKYFLSEKIWIRRKHGCKAEVNRFNKNVCSFFLLFFLLMQVYRNCTDKDVNALDYYWAYCPKKKKKNALISFDFTSDMLPTPNHCKHEYLVIVQDIKTRLAVWFVSQVVFKKDPWIKQGKFKKSVLVAEKEKRAFIDYSAQCNCFEVASNGDKLEIQKSEVGCHSYFFDEESTEKNFSPTQNMHHNSGK